jgi:hypothetical protein
MTDPFISPPKIYNDMALNENMVEHMSPFNDEEIARICQYGDELISRPVRLYGKHDATHVRAQGADFPRNEETLWVYERLSKFAKDVNEECFQYDLTGFYENFYYLSYEGNGDHFDWHLDIGPETPSPRKLSFVLQLSDPAEYEGGDFQIFAAANYTVTAMKCKGARGYVSILQSPSGDASHKWQAASSNDVRSGSKLPLILTLSSFQV